MSREEKYRAEQKYLGADSQNTTNKKVSQRKVDAETKMLNNNPRNNEL